VNRWYEFQDLVHEMDAGLSRIEVFMLGDDEEKLLRDKKAAEKTNMERRALCETILDVELASNAALATMRVETVLANMAAAISVPSISGSGRVNREAAHHQRGTRRKPETCARMAVPQWW
jgi:hypothetical protein